jgi:hypothetical protein
MIPTYAADGRRLRDYALSSIERLLTLHLIIVARNRKGKIVCAHFRPVGGANPLRRAAHLGTRYSFELPLPSGHFAWTHRRLLQSQEIEALFGELDDRDDADQFVRAVFRAVPLSVMRPKPPSPPAPAAAPSQQAAARCQQDAAKVVSIALKRDRSAAIDAGRRKRIAKSERLAA